MIRGGRVVDRDGDRVADVLVRGGRVVEVGTGLSGDETLDADGCVVAPGLVDLHVHLREPGSEEAETIETGTRAAAARRVHRRRRDAEHRAGARRRRGRPVGARGRGAGVVRGGVVRVHHQGPRR